MEIINISDLTKRVDKEKYIKVMDMKGFDPCDVNYGYDKENTVIADYAIMKKC
ncbi:MAG: hypothetical protein Q4B61_07035 [Bacteroidales bacterium]|nr:hypothetical protein [Bacteroidales bacterium]